MSLAVGSMLGAYEVIGTLGAGGMGEVYRAHDGRLNRDVAIKVLPEILAADVDHLARFTREAQTLAALNHPNIAQIYAVEELSAATAGHPSARALVMELVAGEDLSDVIARGPLPLDAALPIARQIIDALEAAHELSIVHRDLKPANIKVRDDGTVKVLDFGLAKATDGAAAGSSAAALSPTLSVRATQLGIILGTAAYMSPEQARGKTVDKRTDVWAFGCVLYEMLAGRKAFDGDDITEIISAVVKTDPDWTALPQNLPANVRTIIERTLVKDRKARIPDLSVIRYILDGVPGTTPGVAKLSQARSATLWRTTAALLLLTTLAAGAAWYRAWSMVPAPARFEIEAPELTTFRIAGGRVGAMGAISPDGLTVAFAAQDPSGRRLLWVRPISSLIAQALPGTDDASYPFWSPNGQTIGYITPGRLMKIAASGGPPQTICPLRGPTISGRGGSWSRDGVVVFNNGPGPLYRVSSDGGTPEPIKSPVPGIVTWVFPSFLPDGRHVLAYAMSTDGGVGGVHVLSIDGNQSKRIVAADTGAIYAADTGHLLFVRQGTLLAQRFDTARLVTSGDAVPVAERVESSAIPGLIAFSVSRTGVLVYGRSNAEQMHQLTWVDREGKPTGSLGSPAQYRGIDLSHDGTKVAAHRHEGVGGDIWVTDVSRVAWSRLTLDPTQDNASPVWSPDGSRIAYVSTRRGKWGVYARASNNVGDEERLFEVAEDDPLPPQPVSWTRDGLLIVVITDKKAERHLWSISLSGEHKATQLTRTGSTEMQGQVSPDGKWLAYVSTENGIPEVYVVSLFAGGGKWPVSSGGGILPRWRGDSRELFFLNGGAGDLMAVDIKATGSTLEPGRPRRLFGSILPIVAHPAPYFPFAVAKDGQHFLIQSLPSGAAGNLKQAIVVVLNWRPR